tara:strand:+ start:1275 stop:1538 length:264 start_codon:yes stop_codon:yes gene_type:complete
MAREVKINFDFINGPAPLDSIKAAVKRVEELEKLNENVPQEDLMMVPVILTGSTPYAVYAYTLATTYMTAEYFFTYVEQAPNVEGLS